MTQMDPVTPSPPLLELAPPKKSGDRILAVVFSGLLSTAISLVLAFLIAHFGDTNVMGWHLNYFIPAGAILVGLFASSGYSLAAWRTGYKMRGLLLALIVLIQVLAYFSAQYMEFWVTGPFVEKTTGHVLNFGEYYHYNTVFMAWSESSARNSSPLGGWGYLVRLGEIVGFALGTLVFPVILMNTPYCELCERYMKRLQLGVIPASGLEVNGDRASSITEKEALGAAMNQLGAFASLGETGDSAAFIEKLAVLRPLKMQMVRRHRRIDMTLVYCSFCKQAYLQFTMDQGSERGTKSVPMESRSVPIGFVSELLASPVLKIKSSVY